MRDRPVRSLHDRRSNRRPAQDHYRAADGRHEGARLRAVTWLRGPPSAEARMEKNGGQRRRPSCEAHFSTRSRLCCCSRCVGAQIFAKWARAAETRSQLARKQSRASSAMSGMCDEGAWSLVAPVEWATLPLGHTRAEVAPWPVHLLCSSLPPLVSSHLHSTHHIASLFFTLLHFVLLPFAPRSLTTALAPSPRQRTRDTSTSEYSECALVNPLAWPLTWPRPSRALPLEARGPARWRALPPEWARAPSAVQPRGSLGSELTRLVARQRCAMSGRAARGLIDSRSAAARRAGP